MSRLFTEYDNDIKLDTAMLALLTTILEEYKDNIILYINSTANITPYGKKIISSKEFNKLLNLCGGKIEQISYEGIEKKIYLNKISLNGMQEEKIDPNASTLSNIQKLDSKKKMLYLQVNFLQLENINKISKIIIIDNDIEYLKMRAFYAGKKRIPILNLGLRAEFLSKGIGQCIAKTFTASTFLHAYNLYKEAAKIEKKNQEKVMEFKSIIKEKVNSHSEEEDKKNTEEFIKTMKQKISNINNLKPTQELIQQLNLIKPFPHVSPNENTTTYDIKQLHEKMNEYLFSFINLLDKEKKIEVFLEKQNFSIKELELIQSLNDEESLQKEIDNLEKSKENSNLLHFLKIKKSLISIDKNKNICSDLYKKLNNKIIAEKSEQKEKNF